MLKFISVLKKFGTLNEQLNQEEGHHHNSSEYDFLWKYVEQPQEILVNQRKLLNIN